jgi:hypothetical protein
MSLEQVVFWFQNEARIGQRNTTTRLWATKGSQPRAVKQQFGYAGHPMLIYSVHCARQQERWKH